MDRGAWWAAVSPWVCEEWDMLELTDTGFPCGSDSKESTCDTRDVSSIPGSGRSPGEGNGYPLQYPFAWRIPWREEPGGLQSVHGSRGVGHA